MLKQRQSSGWHVCFHCGKQIVGEMDYLSVPLLYKAYGAFDKAFHPACYQRAKREAEKELTHHV